MARKPHRDRTRRNKPPSRETSRRRPTSSPRRTARRKSYARPYRGFGIPQAEKWPSMRILRQRCDPDTAVAVASPASGKPCEYPAWESAATISARVAPANCRRAVVGPVRSVSWDWRQRPGSAAVIRQGETPVGIPPENATPAQGPLSDCRATSTASACCASASSQVEHRSWYLS